MGSFANSMFSVLLGWVRGAVNWLWRLFTSEQSSGMVAWLGEHWLVLAAVLCAAGLVMDLVVNTLRWQPYKVWASFFRRLFGRKRQEEPAPRRPVRRAWVYADGTAREEEPEAAPEADAWPAPDAMPMGRVSSADMEERYVMAFAPPEGYRQRTAEPSRLKYQQELDKQQPVQGLEDYPQPKDAPIEPEQERKQDAEPSGRVSRCMLRLNAQRFLNRDEDELQLRYTPAPPPVDRHEAYRAPYVPPQWKKPADVGASVRGEENAHDTAL